MSEHQQAAKRKRGNGGSAVKDKTEEKHLDFVEIRWRNAFACARIAELEAAIKEEVDLLERYDYVVPAAPVLTLRARAQVSDAAQPGASTVPGQPDRKIAAPRRGPTTWAEIVHNAPDPKPSKTIEPAASKKLDRPPRPEGGKNPGTSTGKGEKAKSSTRSVAAAPEQGASSAGPTQKDYSKVGCTFFWLSRDGEGCRWGDRCLYNHNWVNTLRHAPEFHRVMARYGSVPQHCMEAMIQYDAKAKLAKDSAASRDSNVVTIGQKADLASRVKKPGDR